MTGKVLQRRLRRRARGGHAAEVQAGSTPRSRSRPPRKARTPPSSPTTRSPATRPASPPRCSCPTCCSPTRTRARAGPEVFLHPLTGGSIACSCHDGRPWSLRVADDWPEPSAGSSQFRRARARGRHLRVGPGPAVRCAARARLPVGPGAQAFGEVVATGTGSVTTGPGSGDHRAELPVPALPGLPVGPDLDVPGPGDRRVHRARHAGRAGRGARRVRLAGARRLADANAVCTEPLTVALAAIGERGGAGEPLPGCGRRVAGHAAVRGARGLRHLAYVLEPQPGRRDLAVSLGARAARDSDAGFEVVFETSARRPRSPRRSAGRRPARR